MDADPSRFAFREDPGPVGTVRIIDPDEAKPLHARVYDEVWREIPGFVDAQRRLVGGCTASPTRNTGAAGAGPKFVRSCSSSTTSRSPMRSIGSSRGWEDGFSAGRVRLLVETLAATPVATRELWRFVFGIDLIVRIRGKYDPASPLFLLMTDPAQPAAPGLRRPLAPVRRSRGPRWLGGRTTATTRSSSRYVTTFCPWNAGPLARRTGRLGRTDDAAELELDSADLASAYLGAFDFDRLAPGGARA